MVCIGGTITSVEAWVEAVRRCAVEYGGPNWESTAMTGAATVLVIFFVIAVLFLTLRGLRH